MIPWWAAQNWADDHRRALQGEFQAVRLHKELQAHAADVRGLEVASSAAVGRRIGQAPQRTVDGTGRHVLTQHVGSWLIRAGTRLGGASMRTSA